MSPRDAKPDEPDFDTMIISFQGEVVKVNVPKDENQQMISVIVSPTEDATDLYLNGAPVDPETGERMVEELNAPSSVVKAADAIVEAFRNGEWKIGSPSFKQVSAAVDAYEEAKTVATIQELTGGDTDLPESEAAPVNQPATSSAV